MTPRAIYYQSMPPPPLPHKKPTPKPPNDPLLRLEVRDLSSKGARILLSTVECGTVLEEAVNIVLSTLYTKDSKIPPTRSVTLILRSFEGVAFTTGKEIDDDHKEIHLSTDYVAKIPPERRKQELTGVIVHEMVHCWQWAAKGTCPSGLIEGIADYVRLRADLAPPHWNRVWKGHKWDSGYEKTGYFLDYLERRFGDGTVIAINDRLRNREYDEKHFWKQCCDSDIKTLWAQYGKSLEKEDHGDGSARRGADADTIEKDTLLRGIS